MFPNRIFVHCLDCGNSSSCNSSSSTTPLFYSDDFGISWVTQNSDVAAPSNNYYFGLNVYFPAFEVMPNDDQIIYVGGGVLHKSTNGGSSFQNQTSYNGNFGGTWTHADIRAINLSGTNYNTLFIGTDGGILRSTNGGNNYDNLGTTDLVMTQFFDIGTSSTRENVVMGGTQDNGYFSNLDGSWNVQIWGDGGQTLTDWSDNNIVYTRFNGGLYKSNNGGHSMIWESIHGAPGSDWSRDYTHIEQNQKDPNILYLGKNTQGNDVENEFQIFDVTTSTVSNKYVSRTKLSN